MQYKQNMMYIIKPQQQNKGQKVCITLEQDECSESNWNT